MIPHLGFIVAAYAVTALGVAAMIAAVWLDYRDLTARLARLGERKEASR
jgi:heme exporter protein CcmD